jgi:hypothetical protein
MLIYYFNEMLSHISSRVGCKNSLASFRNRCHKKYENIVFIYYIGVLCCGVTGSIAGFIAGSNSIQKQNILYDYYPSNSFTKYYRGLSVLGVSLAFTVGGATVVTLAGLSMPVSGPVLATYLAHKKIQENKEYYSIMEC